MKMTTMAEAAAAAKAIESLYPRGKHLFEDVYSIMFLKPFYRLFINLMKSKRFFSFMMKRRKKQASGVIGGILCRARYIDDVLKSAIDDSFEAVVNLGAGFDTRSLRIPSIDTLQIYEIDYPTVIEEKIRCMSRPPLNIPPNLIFVPIDFNTQNLKEGLDRSGYKLSKKTLFIWEGVTQYITKEALEATLDYISCSAAGSRVVFTYLLKDFVDHPESFPGYQKLIKKLKLMGFQLINGFDPKELSAYLGQHGLLLKEDVGSADYQERYLKPLNREMHVIGIERSALAEVQGK